MKIAIIACGTLENELQKVKRDLNCEYPVIWLPSGLHNCPDKLRQVLQEKIDAAGAYDKILCAMGYCGNAIAGIRAAGAQLIFPKVDDCISLLLGSTAKRKELNSECGTYFLTKGWLDGEKNIWAEYQHALEKYGEKRARRVMKTMLAHYERLGILNTDAYPMEDTLLYTRKMAKEWNLGHEIIAADSHLLKRLLAGPWEEQYFLCIEPGEIIEKRDLMGYC